MDHEYIHIIGDNTRAGRVGRHKLQGWGCQMWVSGCHWRHIFSGSADWGEHLSAEAVSTSVGMMDRLCPPNYSSIVFQKTLEQEVMSPWSNYAKNVLVLAWAPTDWILKPQLSLDTQGNLLPESLAMKILMLVDALKWFNKPGLIVLWQPRASLPLVAGFGPDRPDVAWANKGIFDDSPSIGEGVFSSRWRHGAQPNFINHQHYDTMLKTSAIVVGYPATLFLWRELLVGDRSGILQGYPPLPFHERRPSPQK